MCGKLKSSPVFVDLLFRLFRCPVGGVVEISNELWNLDLYEIVAFMGFVAVDPGKQYLGSPPRWVWSYLCDYLRKAADSYTYNGQTAECLRFARQVLEADSALQRACPAAIGKALYQPASSSWPLPNLSVVEELCPNSD